MKPAGFAPAQGAVARADLLRLLAAAPRPLLVLDDAGEHGLAYREQPPAEPALAVENLVVPDRNPPAAISASPYKLPLQMPFAHVVAERHTREPPAVEPDPTPRLAVEPISEDDAKPLAERRLVDYEDLVPKARLLPALKRHLAHDQLGGLDVSTLVRQIAGQRLPRHLPRRRLQTWHPQWVVVLDFCQRLWPYRQDMHRLAERLLRQCGESGISLRIVNHGPLNPWSDWLEEQRSHGPPPAKRPWRMPAAGTPVLLVSDLGLLEGAQSSTHHAWLRFIGQLSQAQTRPWALLPLGADQLDRDLPKALSLLRWSPDARMHPERAFGGGLAEPAGLAELLAMAAVTRRVDPPLLRAMRQLNPRAPLNAGLEGAFWCHADVEAGAAANIRSEAQAGHLAYFSEHLANSHLALEALRFKHHAHLRAVLNHEETLLWRAHTACDDADLPKAARQRAQAAETFMRQLAKTLAQPNALETAGVWWQVAQDIVKRADRRMGETYPQLLTPLVSAIAEATGDLSSAPDWLDPAVLAGLRGVGSVPCRLVRDARQQAITLKPVLANPPRQTAFGDPLSVDSGGVRIDCAGRSAWLPLPAVSARICSLNDANEITLTTSSETLKLVRVGRPRGAAAWLVESSCLTVVAPDFCGKEWRWRDDDLKVVKGPNGQNVLVEKQLRKSLAPHVKDQGRIFQEGQYASGVTYYLDEYGVLAELLVVTPHGTAAQSFRWIEPGTFLMGSPDDEPERAANEGPQHWVRLSRGYWLADTACSQALWLAVMGNNPSHFKSDPNNPVEQVSWLDVQQFLETLQALLPGCQADLPSEAEWEYACRAGTTTPFSFGANITPAQVNYDGHYPYAGGEQGEYRKRTVPVKTLPANPWGLYEMHGNVYEWCKDGRREYSAQAQTDPLGPTGQDQSRVIRGGSWDFHARWSRSADRIADRPDSASNDLGFRLCLRSIRPGQAAGGPAGSPGRASGASPRAPRVGETGRGWLADKLAAIFKPDPKPKRRS
ncbi:formylglycine-generating enzyme family protein [Methylomonas sp. MS20]|uniref:formylglycine-generating enzyme family protein n=1 Tax=unclassified Methylomonas TaxID=2608980 RepID=UPI0028A56E89|nr:formylglycine-generating enzyme family protein [Methylomonas sp. MV1]MDT4332037.1 formylglycine-generating enzyme family protein [Methylomonas sp. MV1]